jgi:hypothetical protein
MSQTTSSMITVDDDDKKTITDDISFERGQEVSLESTVTSKQQIISHASTQCSSSSGATDRDYSEERTTTNERRKRKKQNTSDPVDSALIAALGHFNKTMGTAQDMEAIILGHQVAETVSRFTARQKGLAKIKISELLFDIEFGTPEQQ